MTTQDKADARAIIRHYPGRIVVLCHLGHVITNISTKGGDAYAGSWDECEVSEHAYGHDNRFDRQSQECKGHGHP